MKKKVLVTMLACAMGLGLLSGCGAGQSGSAGTSAQGSETAQTGSAQESAAADVSISFYTTETGKDTMFLDAIADFEKKNPGIHVEYIAAGDDQLQKWMALYASNEGPTVSFMDPINIYENRERMKAMTKEECPWLDNVQEDAFSTVTFDGNIYGVPGSAAGVGLIYNKAVCDAAVGGDFDPSTIKTRKDLKELFDKIEATGVSASMFTGVNWSLGAHYLGFIYGGARGNVDERVGFAEDQKAGKVKLMEDPLFQGYMDTFDLIAEYSYNKADPLVGNVNLDAEALASGKVGTWFMGDWAWTYLAPIVEDGAEFGLMPIPFSDDDTEYYNTVIPTSYAKAYCVDTSQNTEEEQQAGLKLIEYFSSDKDCQALFAKVCGQAFPYKNFDAEIESPLGQSTASYIAKGLTYDFYGKADLLPSDFWYENGAFMCEYLAKGVTRDQLAANLEAYWTSR